MMLPVDPGQPAFGPPDYDSNREPYHWQNDWRLVSCLAAVVILIVALARDNGDGFYTFVRIYIFGLAFVLVLSFARQRQAVWLLAAILTGILFNPIIPIEMYREDWAPYDLAAAAGFGWIALTGPAKALGKPLLTWAPIGLAAAYAAAVALGASSFQTGQIDNNMAVENLTAENLVVEDDLSADSPPEEWWESSPVIDENSSSHPIPSSQGADVNSALENAARAIENASEAIEQDTNTAGPEAPQDGLANRLQEIMDATNRTNDSGPPK